MTDKLTNTTIEILGKLYPIRCPEKEVKSLQQAADFLNQKMREVQEKGSAINLERIAIISALNIASLYLQMDQHRHGVMDKINQRISQLHEKLETANKKKLQTELIYTTD